ncbi:hypothetical protein [Acinetobacter brisouii]|uniref:hypothetical protein n=1 Tax=Acinetobacter brisouii TaxID=396323 RepID=UPI00124D3022|nr:hypothetical protein [Acinetobacter brisouii]
MVQIAKLGQLKTAIEITLPPPNKRFLNTGVVPTTLKGATLGAMARNKQTHQLKRQYKNIAPLTTCQEGSFSVGCFCRSRYSRYKGEFSILCISASISRRLAKAKNVIPKNRKLTKSSGKNINPITKNIMPALIHNQGVFCDEL